MIAQLRRKPSGSPIFASRCAGCTSTRRESPPRNHAAVGCFRGSHFVSNTRGDFEASSKGPREPPSGSRSELGNVASGGPFDATTRPVVA